VSVARAADIPERRRQEILAALRTVGRVLQRPLERIPADPRHLSAKLQDVAPRAIGLSPGRWANVRSLTRSALALGGQMSPGRHLTPLSPNWEALYRRLPSRRMRMELYRFLRFCSCQGIEPEAFTEAASSAFRADLENTFFLKDPGATFAAMARAWRAAQAVVEGWPPVAIAVPDRRHRNWTHPWSHFPASLRQDCEAWCDRLAGRDLLADGPMRAVRPSTVAHRERQIRTFACAVALQGRDPDTITSLRDLVEIEVLKSGLRYLIARNGGKATINIYYLAAALKAVAQHYLHMEQHRLDQMTAIMRRLAVGRRGLTETNRSRLRQLDDRENAKALVRLPSKLLVLAARNPKARAGALQAQAAVATEILLMAPIRIGNLAGLDLDRNLIRPGSGKEIHIVIEPEDVKNEEPLHFPLPAQSAALIDRYLTEFRPHLATPRCTALFPGKGGGPKSLSTLRAQISKTVKRYTGMTINPHLFRHIAAKLYLDENPGGYEVVRRVLAHRSTTTTETFYCGLETVSAVRHFDETILKIREKISQ
jgi:integrase